MRRAVRRPVRRRAANAAAPGPAPRGDAPRGRTSRGPAPRRLAAAAVFVLLLSSGTAGAAESPGPAVTSSPDATAAAEPAADAATVEPTVTCRLPAGQGERTGPQRITVTLSPAEVAPGGTVHVEVDLGPTPATSPLALRDAPFTPGIEFALSGGADGTVTVFGGTTAVDVPLAPERIRIPSYEGDFMMPADARGPVTLTPTRTLTVTRVLDRDHETPCVVRSGGGAVGTVGVAGEPLPSASLTAADATVVAGGEIALSGARWTPGSEPRAVLCAADGTACSPAKFTAASLAVDADGRLSGTVTLADPGMVSAGEHRLRVFDGTHEASTKLTVRTQTGATPDPSPSTSPTRPADVFPGGTAPDGSTADPATSPTPAAPSSSASPTADASAVHGAGAGSGGGHPSTGGTAGQSLATYITPGPLSMDQSGSAIDFGVLALGEQTTATGTLNTITVSDGRGYNIGWSLTATLTDLRTPEGAVIPASAVTWDPACAAEQGSVGRPEAGTAGPLGPEAVSLCTMSHHMRTPFTGGRFTADADLTLTVDGFVPPGDYKATLQLTLL